MGRKTSIYINSGMVARLSALGDPPLPDVIRRGVAAMEAEARPPAREIISSGTVISGGPLTICPPHPAARVHRGLCGACGRNTGDEAVR